MEGFETREPITVDSPEDQYRWKSDDPETIANDLEYAAQGLEWAMLSADGAEFIRLLAAARRIGEIAEQGWILAQFD